MLGKIVYWVGIRDFILSLTHQEAFGLPPAPLQCGNDSLRHCMHLPPCRLHHSWPSWPSNGWSFSEMKLFPAIYWASNTEIHVLDKITLGNTFSINTFRLRPPQPKWILRKRLLMVSNGYQLGTPSSLESGSHLDLQVSASEVRSSLKKRTLFITFTITIAIKIKVTIEQIMRALLWLP